MSWYRSLSNALTTVFTVGGAGMTVMTVVRLAGTSTVSASVVIVGKKRLQAIPAIVTMRVFMRKDIDELARADIQRPERASEPKAK